MRSLAAFLVPLLVFSGVVYPQDQWTVYDNSNSPLPESSVCGGWTSCITALAIDSHGNKWIGLDGSGQSVPGKIMLLRFSGTEWTIWSASELSSELGEIHGGQVRAISFDSQDNVWVGTYKGLCKFDGEKWTNYSTSNSGICGNNILALAFDKKGLLWIGTDDNGISTFDGTNWATYDTTNSVLRSNFIKSITVEESGTVWICSEGGKTGGLAVFDGTDWKFFNTDNSDIPTNQPGYLAIDKQGNKWMTAPGAMGPVWLASKLFKFDGIKWSAFDTGFYPYGVPDLGLYLQRMAIEDNGKMWITSDLGGLYEFDGVTFKNYTKSNSGLPYNSSRVIAIDANGNKWIGTGGGGLVVLKGENDIITGVETTPSQFGLLPNYPNPFNPSTTIAYSIPEQAFVSLTIHNSLGQAVRMMVNNLVSAGRHEEVWNGLDAAGEPCADGIYFTRLQMGNMVRTNKMLLMK